MAKKSLQYLVVNEDVCVCFTKKHKAVRHLRNTSDAVGYRVQIKIRNGKLRKIESVTWKRTTKFFR